MKNINDYVVSIQENMEKKIEIIRGIEYHYELESLIKDLNGLPDTEKDIVLENLLNKYLELLKPIYTKEKFKEVTREVDDITDFFADWGEDEEDDYIVSEGDMVADDLICKVIGDNDRNIQLPVELKYLKDYCITSLISPKLMDRVITWIILRYATTYYCVTNPKKN